MKEKLMPKVISATEASNRFGSLISEASRGNTLFVITRLGKAQAVIIGVEQYKELMEELEIIQEQNDPEFQAALEEAEEDHKLGRTVTLEELDKEFGFTEKEIAVTA